MRNQILSLVLLATCACPPRAWSPADAGDASLERDGYTVTVTVTDASHSYDADPMGCGRACDVLRAMGCPEGDMDGGLECERACEHAQSSGIFDVKPACIAAANTVDQVRACGSVACRK